MRRLKNIFRITFLFLLFSLTYGKVSAVTYDFYMTNNTTLTYITGRDTVDVKIEFIREIVNKNYFFSTKGEKIFHIPDSAGSKDYEVQLERQYKIDSIKVTNEAGKSIPYTVEELPFGEGIYITVPNYKQTNYGSPYKIYLEYKTHTYVKHVYDWTVIQMPGLHEDTQFEQRDEQSGTNTKIDYNLDIVVQNDIGTLAKIFPTKYKESSTSNTRKYSFDGKDRVSVPVHLEFGTKQVFKFEVNLITPKTDSFIPEKYSSVIGALSTNIYQIPLPREFGETNQRVMIKEIYPNPSKIVVDQEGNVFGTFEVPANQSSKISFSGYIWVEQDSYSNTRNIPNPLFTEYRDEIKANSNLNRYLQNTSFWEVSDSFIQSKAQELMENKIYLMDVIRSDYAYVNDILEYDYSKAENDNKRIGAKAALQGGGSVCMEYADSMIALLRAQGIPTRAATGYVGLDVQSKTEENGNTPHQWVQVWIPEYGWLSIDPTYESINMKIGANVDYALWETFFDESQTTLGLFTADSLDKSAFSKDNYSIKVYAVSENDTPEIESLFSYSDIATSTTDYSVEDTINILFKTTSLGKALLIILPISIVLISMIIIFSLIKVVIKRVKYRKAP